MADEIEEYWEDIRFYKPDPIIQLRAEDRVRKSIAEELGLNVDNYSSLTFDQFIVAMTAKRANKLAEQPRMISPLDGLVAGGRTVSEAEALNLPSGLVYNRANIIQQPNEMASLLNLNELQEVVRAIRPR